MAEIRRTTLSRLVPAYVRHSLRAVQHVEPDPDFWTFDEVNDRVGASGTPEDSWDLMTAIIRAAPDEALGYIGAGPVEDMVRHHGSALVEWIEGEARRDPRFQFALGCIWINRGDLPAPILERLQHASGGRIAMLDENDQPPAT
jgi:hypothetical protein